MTGEHDAMSGSNDELLHAYHDGELSRLGRWRFERTLRHSPALQRELASLRQMRGALQALDGTADAPDLWESLRPRLAGARAKARDGAISEGRGRGIIWWLAPLAAAAPSGASHQMIPRPRRRPLSCWRCTADSSPARRLPGVRCAGSTARAAA